MNRFLLFALTAGLFSPLSAFAEKAQAESVFFYFGRGVERSQKKDYSGCISEMTKAIEKQPPYTDSYLYRASCKSKLGDYDGAIADYNKAFDLGGPSSLYPVSPSAYGMLGMYKAKKGDMEGACADWRKASSFGDEEVASWVRKWC